MLKREIVRGSLALTVAAIARSPPREGRAAVLVSAAVKKRLGLDENASWIVTDELNAFVRPWPDLRPISTVHGSAGDRCYYGYVPNSLLEEVKAGIAENWAAQRVRLVKRSD